MLEAPIPALRRDLDVQFRRNGTVDVRDPLLIQVFNLEAEDFRRARRFDGRRSAHDLATADMSAQAWMDLAEEFRELYLLDTPEVFEQEPNRENLTPYSQIQPTRRKLKVLPESHGEARWSCRACGACCHGLTVEIRPDEMRRIDPALYQDVLQGEDFCEWTFLDPDEPKKRVLRQVPERNNACVFLDDRGLCRVHARQGMQAKPDACQIFPHVVMHVPGGPPRLTLRLNCESMHESFEDGPRISSHMDEVVRVHETSPALKAPRDVDLFGTSVPFREFDRLMRQAIELFETEGIDGETLKRADQALCRGRVRRVRRRFGRSFLAYVDAEANSEIPVEEGAFFPSLKRLRRGRQALQALAAGTPVPRVPAPVERFLVRQTVQALWGMAPLNLPDAGHGLVGLLLAVEAAMHAVGPRGRLITANTAFWVFTGPLLESTHHAWPLIESIDPHYAEALKRDMAPDED